MAIDYKKLAAQAAEHIDQTETTSGGDYERPLIPAGVTIARFVEYVELGVQPQRPYEGVARPDCAEARFGFELLHPKNKREIEVDGKKVEVYDRFYFKETIKFGEKSKFTKLLKTMKYGRTDITHFAQMLNDTFLLTFVHNESEKDGKKVVYTNLYTGGVYGIQPPVVVDPITQESKTVPVPPATIPIKIFLWDLPNKETWDSLYIAGTRKVKEGKVEKEVSKNWLQDTIIAAKNFSGSPLEDLLTGSAELTAAVEKAEEKPRTTVKKSTAKSAAPSKEPEEDTPVATVKAAVTKSPTKETVKSKAKAPAEAEDPLAALGL